MGELTVATRTNAMTQLARASDHRPFLSRRRILIVEDNNVFVRQISKAVAQVNAGYQISVCRTGSEALRLVQDAGEHFDLALVDLGLPDISGIDVIHEVRGRFADIPIMVISVVSAESAVLAAIRAGARGYILKGESEAMTAAAIEDVLCGNYPISPALARSLFKLAGAPVASATPATNQFDLSPREFETLKHIARGHNYGEVAKLMGISMSTVESNIRNLYRKLNAHSQMQAVTKARDAGLI